MARPTPIIARSEVEAVVVQGAVIEDYPEDVRGHSGLMLATPEGRAVHVGMLTEGRLPGLEALVDTCTGYSVVPRPILEALGCRVVRSQRVVLADGRAEEWLLTQIDVECEGRRVTTPVLMGPPAGVVRLGATTLEELGLGIDPLNRRLVPVDLYLAGGVGHIP
jgi:predicted aspartyl protease